MTPNRTPKSRFKLPSRNSPSLLQKKSIKSPKESPRFKTPQKEIPSKFRNSPITITIHDSAKKRHYTNTPTKKPKAKSYDRFIPNRHQMDTTTSQYHMKEKVLDQQSLQYQEIMAKACGVALEKRILQFSQQPPQHHDIRATWNRPVKPKTSIAKRRIPLAPEKILDAPGIADDFYLNLMDWSSRNILAVGLENTVYIWNGDTGQVHEFCKTSEDDAICSLKWASDGSYLAVGTGTGDAQIWDLDSTSKIRSMRGHSARVGVLSWDQHILSSGCRDGSIFNHDVRVAQHKVAELNGHSSEVCGLAWRPDGNMLASGGNDNQVQIWDARSSLPRMTKNHVAAVKVFFSNKAVAWCPWQLNLLSTGGGKQDHHIHFWNTTTGGKVNSINTGSQVTSIQWSVEYKEFISSHGFPNNELSVWSYPSLQKIADLPGHDARILNTCISPDGQIIASSSSDENLKFWKVFESRKKKVASVDDELSLQVGKMTIR
jgi:cell division cycle protein 20 (cofactor of APC complex)